MTTHWALETQGQTIQVVRNFLEKLYVQASLDAMLVPLRTDNPQTIEMSLIDDHDWLQIADPFAPIMHNNCATLTAQTMRAAPHKQLGAVLRSCELQALHILAEREALDLSNTLLIGVDCFGTFSAEDVEWRESVSKLSGEVLQFARQGGIAPYRYRSACQMCADSIPQKAHLNIGLSGLPAQRVVMISIHNESLEKRLNLDDLVTAKASQHLLAQRETMCNKLRERRLQARERILKAFEHELADNFDELIDHLENCEACITCLAEACPVHPVETAQRAELNRDTITDWITACVECGICDEHCPDHLPLTQIIASLRSVMLPEAM